MNTWQRRGTVRGGAGWGDIYNKRCTLLSIIDYRLSIAKEKSVALTPQGVDSRQTAFQFGTPDGVLHSPMPQQQSNEQ